MGRCAALSATEMGASAKQVHTLKPDLGKVYLSCTPAIWRPLRLQGKHTSCVEDWLAVPELIRHRGPNGMFVRITPGLPEPDRSPKGASNGCITLWLTVLGDSM